MNLAVAEYLSFNRAARALGTSQSSVSACVKALEEELGVLLFQRKRPVTPSSRFPANT
ncbi:helix-turn-helix domain-containing protein [Shinella sp.]|uniref:helix-turn-helix domain-containing protein n=1 Tax=Shinella sp. TaxID=1870904 RepID=UPI003D2BD809